MKKKYVFIISVVVLSLSISVFPRLLGNTDIRNLYVMKGLVQSYVNPKADNPIDFVRQSFKPGICNTENNIEKYYLYIKTNDELTDVLSDIYLLNNEICGYISSNCVAYDKNMEIEICIEKWSFWIIRVYPMSKKISLGLNSNIPITEALDFLKDFEEISIGGYWGYSILIPDNFDSKYLEEFDNLKTLHITDVTSEEYDELSKQVLSSNGIEITIES